MSYSIVWSAEVVSALRRLRASEPDAAKLLIAAIRALADDPHPPGSAALGGTSIHRLRIDERRVLYEVDDSAVTIHVLMVGIKRRRPTN